jgi:hypothetical protein
MDTKALLADTKARFNHNSAKAALAEKHNSKLLVADQGGLWRADAQTISLLHALGGTGDMLSMMLSDEAVLIDTFNNPVLVSRHALLIKLTSVYDSVMKEWHAEWKELESKR